MNLAPQETKQLVLLKKHLRARIKLAKSKTKGAWRLWPTHWAGGCSSVQVNGKNAPWLKTSSGDRRGISCAMFGNPYQEPRVMLDGRFIEAASKDAELAWASVLQTITNSQSMLSFRALPQPVKDAHITTLRKIIKRWRKHLA